MSSELIHQGLERSWLEDGSIVCYTPTQISPEGLTAWRDAILEMLTNWECSRPYLALHDLSSRGVGMGLMALGGKEAFNIGITRLGQGRVEAVLGQKPALRVCLAVLVSAETSGQMTTQMGLPHVQMRHPQIETKAFFNRAVALNWLRQHLTTPTPSS